MPEKKEPVKHPEPQYPQGYLDTKCPDSDFQVAFPEDEK
jgi:hypothetical protein